MPKPIRLLTELQMSSLTTPRLLAYKNKLLKVVDGPSYEALYEGESWDTVNKSRADWQTTMTACKTILAGREHSPKKARGPKP